VARANGLKGFKAIVLKDNSAMLHIFRNHYPNLTESSTPDGEINLMMPFRQYI